MKEVKKNQPESLETDDFTEQDLEALMSNYKKE